MQAIFSERKDDLNLALDEMKDKVTSLMHGVPAHGSHGHGHGGHGHAAASALPHGRSAGNVKRRNSQRQGGVGGTLAALHLEKVENYPDIMV